MLRIRASHSVLSHNPVFPAPLGNLRDPSNTQAGLRDAFQVAGFEWVTSHVRRKTVATLVDQAGLFGRRVTDIGAADVLEALA
jgi:hypothetical protein